MASLDLSKIRFIIETTPGQEMTMDKIDKHLLLEDQKHLQGTNLGSIVNMWKSGELNPLKAIKSIKSLVENPTMIVKI